MANVSSWLHCVTLWASLSTMPCKRGQNQTVSLMASVRATRSSVALDIDAFAKVLKASSMVTLAALKTLPVTPCVVRPEAQPSTQSLAPAPMGTTPQITIAANSTNISALAVKPKTSKGHVTAKVLAKRWNIGLETAQKTVDSTTQLAVRDFTHTTGGRRLKPYAYQLRYPRLNVEMYTDTLIGRCKSLSGNRYVQVYATPFHWVTVLPMPLKSEAHLTLDEPWLAGSAGTNRPPDKSGSQIHPRDDSRTHPTPTTMTFQLTQRKPTASYTKATQKINSRTMTNTTSPTQTLHEKRNNPTQRQQTNLRQLHGNLHKNEQTTKKRKRTNNQKATLEIADQKASRHSHNLRICRTR
jgi:hypothetical protein